MEFVFAIKAVEFWKKPTIAHPQLYLQFDLIYIP